MPSNGGWEGGILGRQIRTAGTGRRSDTAWHEHTPSFVEYAHLGTPCSRILVAGRAPFGTHLQRHLQVERRVLDAGCVGGDVEAEHVDAGEDARVECGDEVLIEGERDGDEDGGGVEGAVSVVFGCGWDDTVMGGRGAR